MAKHRMTLAGANTAAGEAAAAMLRECCVAALDQADALLRLSTGPRRHYGIHHARKVLRQARAALRLVRDDMGRRSAACDKTLQRLCRRLSAARDAQAAVEVFDRLERHHTLPEELRAALVELRRHRVQALLDVDPALHRLCHALAAAREDVLALPWKCVRAMTPVRTFARATRRTNRALGRTPRGARKRHRLRRRLRRWLMQRELMAGLTAAIPALAMEQRADDEAIDRLRIRRAHLLARERDLHLLDTAAESCDDLDAELRQRLQRLVRCHLRRVEAHLSRHA